MFVYSLRASTLKFFAFLLLSVGLLVGIVIWGSSEARAVSATSLMASMELNGHSISAAVVDAMFVKPMDTELIRQMAVSAKLVVTIEENALRGGFGEGVAAEMAALNLNTRVLNLGIPDRPIRHASRSEQLKECGLDVYSVVDAIVNKLNS